MANEFVFIPWMRPALGTRAVAPASGRARPRVPVGLQVSANGTVQTGGATSDIELYAAGDIASIEPAMVVRVEPPPGTRAVEPNYFPFIELADADFPWRYTLDTAQGNRVRPWLVLIALRAEEFRNLPRVPDALPAIEVVAPAASLPDLSQSWAWAHVQVDLTAANAEPAALAQVVRSDAAAHFSRLLCPRRLAAETLYHLFLVPTFEAGRLRGLGSDAAASPWNASAWSATTTGPLQLPCYAAWSFVTSADEDFESLVRRLTPRDLDGAVALRGAQVRGGETGYFPGYLDPAVTFEAEGALRTPLADDTRTPFAADGLTTQLTVALTASIAPLAQTGGRDSDAAEDPLFTLPAYGHLYKGTAAIRAPLADHAWPVPDPWIHEANLDRRYRLAAGIGSRVVRRHQEQFMSWAWAQAGEITAANRLIALAHAAKRLHQRMEARYAGALDPTLAVSLAEPMLGMIRYPGVGRTVAAELERFGLPRGVLTVTEQKLLAKRPERIRAAAVVGPRRGTVRRPASVVVPGKEYGGVKMRAMKGGARAEAQRRRQERGAWTAAVFPKADRASADRFLRAAAPSTTTVFEQRAMPVAAIKDALFEQLAAVPGLRVARQIAGLRGREAEELAPVLRGPRIAEPMYRYLAEQGVEFLLPGVRQLPDDTVGVLLENRRFIEAFLLGANHEMNRELLWREFPSDLRSTVFSRFWDRGLPLADPAYDDILPFHEWNGRLGTHRRGGQGEDLVLIVRGELVRRFPGFLIALNRQRLKNKEWRPDAGQMIAPRFWGRIGDDTRLFGFPITEAELRAEIAQYFFVIYEPAGRYRFGLDVATHAVRRLRRSGQEPTGELFPLMVFEGSERRVRHSSSPQNGTAAAPVPAVPATWNDLSWSHATVTGAGYVNVDHEIHPQAGDVGQWGAGAHSAHLASVTFQKPVRVVMAARRMVGDA